MRYLLILTIVIASCGVLDSDSEYPKQVQNWEIEDENTARWTGGAMERDSSSMPSSPIYYKAKSDSQKITINHASGTFKISLTDNSIVLEENDILFLDFMNLNSAIMFSDSAKKITGDINISGPLLVHKDRLEPVENEKIRLTISKPSSNEVYIYKSNGIVEVLKQLSGY